MAQFAAVAAVVSAVAAVGSGVAQSRAASATNEAQKKLARIERARAQEQHLKSVKRAIQARNTQRAQIIAASQAENAGFSSGVAGAVGSLGTQTASNVGFAASQLSAANAQSIIGQRGATRSVRFGNLANTFGAISTASSVLGKQFG